MAAIIKLPSFITAVVGVPETINPGWNDITIIPGSGGSAIITNSAGQSITIVAPISLGGGGDNSFNIIWSEIVIEAVTANCQVIVNGDVFVLTAEPSTPYDDSAVFYKDGSRSMTGNINFANNAEGVVWTTGGSSIKEVAGVLTIVSSAIDIDSDIYFLDGTYKVGISVTFPDTLNFGNGFNVAIIEGLTYASMIVGGNSVTVNGIADSIQITSVAAMYLTSGALSPIELTGNNIILSSNLYTSITSGFAFQSIAPENRWYNSPLGTEGVFWKSNILTGIRDYTLPDKNITIAGINNETFTGFAAMSNAAAPSVETDKFKMYATDIVAGNSAPHFQTENGDIIKIFSQSGWTEITGTALKGGWDTTTGSLIDVKRTVKAIVDYLRTNTGHFKA